MRRKLILLSLGVALVVGGASAWAGLRSAGGEAGTPWSFDATYIEACSCHLFCPCYFNNQAEHPYCEFNMAVRVNDGAFGGVSLEGAKFWITGDLGEHWGTKHKSPWLVVTFDPAVSQAQRDGILKILGQLYPVEWGEVHVDESEVSWTIEGRLAKAKLANGNGEMILERFPGNDGRKAVLHNVKYWAADENDGFVMYKSKVHRWDGFGHSFEYTGRNAFTIRLRSSGTL